MHPLHNRDGSPAQQGKPASYAGKSISAAYGCDVWAVSAYQSYRSVPISLIRRANGQIFSLCPDRTVYFS